MFLGQGPANEPLLVSDAAKQPRYISIMSYLRGGGGTAITTFPEDPLEVWTAATSTGSEHHPSESRTNVFALPDTNTPRYT